MTADDIPHGWADIVICYRIGIDEGRMDRAKEQIEELERQRGSGGGSPSIAGGGGGKRIRGASGHEMEEFQRAARAKLAADKAGG